MAIATTNPTTGETLRTFPPHDAAAIEAALARAAAAAPRWRRTPVGERAGVLSRAAAILEHDAEAFGRLMTLEMGKLLGAAIDEAKKCAVGCRYYAENGGRFLASEVIVDDRARKNARVDYQPLGAVLAVMPWNFPFWQVLRFAAPALAAGNVALLKHASNVPQCALALEDLFRRAGAPAGVFQTLLVGSDVVPRLIADPRVAAVTVTGSEAAGRSIAAEAGRHLKKTVLELGGSDPFVVMPSADLDRAIADGRAGAHRQQRPVVHRSQAVHRRRRHLRSLRARIRRRHGSPAHRRSGCGRHRARPAGHGVDPRRARRTRSSARSWPARAC